jgi:hypothetical protein
VEGGARNCVTRPLSLPVGARGRAVGRCGGRGRATAACEAGSVGEVEGVLTRAGGGSD